MAASKPTNQLSLETHILVSLSLLLGALYVCLGCFPLDEWHLSATVGLLAYFFIEWIRPSELVKAR